MNLSVVRIEPHRLSATALDGLVEEVASRYGTDHETVEVPLRAKSQQLKAMLGKGEVALVFDLESDTYTLVESRTWDCMVSKKTLG